MFIPEKTQEGSLRQLVLTNLIDTDFNLKILKFKDLLVNYLLTSNFRL